MLVTGKSQAEQLDRMSIWKFYSFTCELQPRSAQREQILGPFWWPFWWLHTSMGTSNGSLLPNNGCASSEHTPAPSPQGYWVDVKTDCSAETILIYFLFRPLIYLHCPLTLGLLCFSLQLCSRSILFTHWKSWFIFPHHLSATWLQCLLNTLV